MFSVCILIAGFEKSLELFVVVLHLVINTRFAYLREAGQDRYGSVIVAVSFKISLENR